MDDAGLDEDLDDEGRTSFVPPSRHSRPSAPALFLASPSASSEAIGGGRAASSTERSAAPEWPPDGRSAGTSDGAPDSALRCAACGATSPPGYRFCVSCGAELLIEGASSGSTHRPPAVASRPSDKDTSDRGLAEALRRPPLSLDLRSDSESPAARPTPPPSEPPSRAALSHTASSPGRSLTARTSGSPEVTGRLVVIIEDGSEGREIELHGEQLDVGRRTGDIVLPEDRYMSPRHARLLWQDGGWHLRDLNSTNGVYRRLRKPEVLTSGDLVLLGLEVLQFEPVRHAERGLGHAMEHGTLVFGSPAVTRRARLCQRTIEGIRRDVHYLVAEETTIGREMGDIVFTSDPFMSRRHALIRWRESTQDFILSDLDSSNGTYLAIRDDIRLNNGDFIRMGQHLFRVDLPQSGRKTH